MGECELNNASILSLPRGWHRLFFHVSQVAFKSCVGRKKANSCFLLCHVLISKSRTKVRHGSDAFACWPLHSPVLCPGPTQPGGRFPCQCQQPSLSLRLVSAGDFLHCHGQVTSVPGTATSSSACTACDLLGMARAPVCTSSVLCWLAPRSPIMQRFPHWHKTRSLDSVGKCSPGCSDEVLQFRTN